MRKLIIKTFIKNYKNHDDPNVRTAYGKLSGVVGIISNLILCSVKIIVGVLVGSIAILADGINNLSDAASSIITFIGFKLSSIPADEHHPFGHQRIEYITGLIVSFFIVAIGLLLMYSSVMKIINPVEMEVNLYIIIVLVIAILIKIWQSHFYRQNGKLINSKALIVTSVDSLMDVITTSAVLLSTILVLLTKLNLDAYMGIAVSILIIISGIKLVKETISPLLGEAPPKEYLEEISNKILSYQGVLGIHDLIVHSYGPAKTFITAHVEVDSLVHVNVSHDIIDNIEQDFLNIYHANLVIHMDPIDTKCEVTLRLKAQITKILEEIDPILHFHDFRIVKGPTHTKIIFDLVIPLKYEIDEEEIKKMINEKVKSLDKSLNLKITVDREFII